MEKSSYRQKEYVYDYICTRQDEMETEYEKLEEFLRTQDEIVIYKMI